MPFSTDPLALPAQDGDHDAPLGKPVGICKLLILNLLMFLCFISLNVEQIGECVVISHYIFVWNMNQMFDSV